MLITEIQIGTLILKNLKEQERSISWLARKVHRDASNLGRLLRHNSDLPANLLLQISIALEKDFFAYYSQFIDKTKTVEIT